MDARQEEVIIHHIGKKVPKNLEELSGSIHLGKGIWCFKCRVKIDKQEEGWAND